MEDCYYNLFLLGKGTSYIYKAILSQCTMGERLHCNSPGLYSCL